MKRVLLGCLICITPLYATTLQDATTHARSERPLLKAHSHTIAQSEHLESHAMSAYLPQLSAQYRSLFDQEHSTLNKSIHSLSLSGTQLIYKPNGPQLQSKIAATGTERAQHTFRASSNQVQHDVVHAFLSAWLLQEKEALIDALKGVSDIAVDRAHVAYKNDHINRHEHALTQATSAQQHAEVLAFPHEKRAAFVTLQTLMGTRDALEDSTLSYTEEERVNVPDLDECITQAHRHRPEIKEKQSALKQLELTARSHRLGYLPTVSLQGSYGRVFAGTGSQRGTNASLGITATWSFFDGMQRSYAARAVDASALRTEFELQELKNSITRDVTAAYHALHAALAKRTAAQRAYDAQKGLWEQAQESFELGSLDRISQAQQRHAYEQAAHTLRTEQVNCRKHLETLHLRCGYALSTQTQGASS